MGHKQRWLTASYPSPPLPSPIPTTAGVAADEFDVLRPGCDRTCKCFCSIGARKNEKFEYEAMLNLAHNMKVQSGGRFASGAKQQPTKSNKEKRNATKKK